MYYGSSTYEAPVIRAAVANDALVALIGEVLPYWEETHEALQAEYGASKETEIDRLMTVKTFWTRRTRTRDEAVKLFSDIHNWGWNLDLWHKIGRAANNVSRLKEIRKFAEENSFQNITLPEGDLRLVGGPPENR